MSLSSRSNPGDSTFIPMEYSAAGPSLRHDPRIPLQNLSAVRTRMDSLQRFLSESVNCRTLVPKGQMEMVSAEIASAIHQIIVNGAALLSVAQPIPEPPPPDPEVANKEAATVNYSEDAVMKEESEDDSEIVEIDAVELLSEHIHFCEICGKGFKRDANLRMHMRAHGNQYKTPEALAKKASQDPELQQISGRKIRFSCPYDGCNRNKSHRRFRPLKSIICVRNHFKRCHCPKMYACNRCHTKSFSVVADLRSHLKHCVGEEKKKWKCCCGNSFSRKDKLFGHMAVFEGHMPAVAEEEVSGGLELDFAEDSADNGFFEGLLDEFGSFESYSLQDVLGSPGL